MHPTIFTIPLLNAPIYGYGLMMVFAFLGTQWLSGRLASRLGYDPEIFVNATLLALVSGVIGSRMSHVLENWPDYTRADLSVWQNLWNMVNIRSGGLTFYGGLILAFIVVFPYVVYKKVPGRTAMDIAAPCIMLGLGIGRIGCFLNGCCYGQTADVNHVPWAVRFPYNSNAYVDQFEGNTGSSNTLGHTVPAALLVHLPDDRVRLKTPEEVARDPAAQAAAAAERSNYVHPTQLYSTLTSLLIMGVLLCYFSVPHVTGRGFALMLILEGPSRYLLEMLRVEPPVVTIHGWAMSFSMVLGLLMFLTGLGLWLGLGLIARRSPGSFYARRPYGLATA